MEHLIYSKYSNERSVDFALRTDIIEKENSRLVKKTPLYKEGEKHVEKLADWYEKLEKIFERSSFVCNKCSLSGNSAVLEYVYGETMEERLDSLLKKGDTDSARCLLKGYLKEVEKIYAGTSFVKTKEFEAVFGNAALDQNLECGKVTDIDMVCQNVVCTEPPVILDYEWTFEFPIPCKFVLYRIIHYYIHTNPMREVLDEESLYTEFGIDQGLRETFGKMEKAFQRYITKGHVPMRDMFMEISPGVIQMYHVQPGHMQIYFSFGEGYCEENSVVFPIKDGEVSATVEIPEGCTEIRVDPGDEPCVVLLKKLDFDGKTANLKGAVAADGVIRGNQGYIARKDPGIEKIFVPEGAKELEISLVISNGSLEIIKQLVEAQKENKILKRKVQYQAQLIQDMKNTKIWKIYEKYRKKVERK